MKKQRVLSVILITLLVGASVYAQALVDDWGATDRGSGWPILNTAETPAGDAGMGDGAPPATWATIFGGFDEVEATAEQAVIVRGQLEYVGEGPGSHYCPLRYALTYRPDPGTLNHQHTDSAMWAGGSGHSGYQFTPVSGNADMSNGAGGAGTVWMVNNAGGWNSTWGNNGYPFAVNPQAPRLAEIVAGVYDFGISVHLLEDGSNEIRYYLVHEDGVSYWFGGIANDTLQVTTKFNGIGFGIGDGITTAMSQFNLMGITVETGDPIDVPAAPFEPFYVSDWGATERGSGWPILNTEDTWDGDAGMGDGAPPATWATIRGGFWMDVEATTEEAIIVTGQLEYVGEGPGSHYCPIRYALTYQPDKGTLNHQYTDSAMWAGGSGHSGYQFTPVSGNADMSNGAGGAGTVWMVNNAGGWNSTWGNNGYPFAVNPQVPRLAEIVAGVYDFAISVQPLADGSNEIRYYLVHEDGVSYWFGGIANDTLQVTTKFNSIAFGIGDGITTAMSQFNLLEVRVDRGDPIDLPDRPFTAHYVGNWGFIGNAGPTRTGGWHFVPGDFTGNAGVAGDAPVGSNWAAIRGGFDDEVYATEENAILVTGQIEFLGAGPSSWSALRYGVFNHTNPGELVNADTDSALWTGTESPAQGYMFTPHSGTNDQVGWGFESGAGTQGATVDGNWISSWSAFTLGVIDQKPPRAEFSAGLYDWAISVQPQGDGTNEVRFYMVKEDNSYWYGGIVTDTAGVTTKFNGVCFAVQGAADMRAFNVIDVHVDRGVPFDIPEAPFTPHYVGNWGFIGGRMGGWEFAEGDFAGNAGMKGDTPPADWAALRGEFDDVVKPSTDEALRITGQMEFVDGGFVGWSSLRMGVFYSETAGDLVDDAWTGAETNNFGYLFLPHSGTNELTNWQGIGQLGTVGAVVDRPWISTNGANDYVIGTDLQHPEGAEAGAGLYDFAFSFALLEDGNTEVRYLITNADDSYTFAGWLTDVHDPIVTHEFNSFNIALGNGATATELKLMDVYVDRGDPIELPEWVTSIDAPDAQAIPAEFALNQNYPNPFNPATTIEFALPQHSEVSLVIYDALGRVVAELAKGQFNAGYHKVNFDAANLPSGVYLYKLKAGDQVSVRKLMLMK
ncbi:MAG TPA: T9SS type A sorting domain-containing protein [bacterium]|nr:T9SS type A sorting domain-containing protein [bacterium]